MVEFSSLSFDVACQELFGTWQTGGVLTLVREGQEGDLPAVREVVAEAGIQRLFLPFVALQHLALSGQVAGGASRPRNVKEVITAGEQLQVTSALRAFFAEGEQGSVQARLFNQYGPAESHVVTAWEVCGGSEEWPLLPPIGTPVANTRIYLLDEQGEPGGIGQVGEMYVAGGGVGGGGGGWG